MPGSFLKCTTTSLPTDDLKMEEESMKLGVAHNRLHLEGKGMARLELGIRSGDS